MTDDILNILSSFSDVYKNRATNTPKWIARNFHNDTEKAIEFYNEVVQELDKVMLDRKLGIMNTRGGLWVVSSKQWRQDRRLRTDANYYTLTLMRDVEYKMECRRKRIEYLKVLSKVFNR